MDLPVIKQAIWGDLSGIDEAVLERIGERLNQEPEDLWLDDLLTSNHEVEAVELGELARSFAKKMGFQLEP